MTEYVPKPLPRGYGPAAEEPPDEPEAICECGHPIDGHNTKPDGEAGDLYEALEALYESVDQQAHIRFALFNMKLAKAMAGAEMILALCQAKNCECRKPTVRESSYDSPDTLAEARGEI